MFGKTALTLAAALSVASCFLFVVACSDDVTGVEDDELTLSLDDTDFETTDWTTATHSKNADPDFDRVFQDGTVKRIDIVITEERWALMLADMTDLYGTFGRGGGLPVDSDEDSIFVPAGVFYDGTEWYRVGDRFEGNSSLKSS